MADIFTQTPVVTLDGSELSATLVHVRVELSVQRAGTATLRIDDPEFALLDRDTFQVGQKLKISFHSTTNTVTDVFEGAVTTVGMRQDEGQVTPTLEVLAHDASYRLLAASLFKAYVEQSPADVVQEIAKRHGLTPEIEAATTVVPYLLQSGTDHHFLSHLATLLGHEWFTMGTTLHFRPRPTKPEGPTLKYSEHLLSFAASYSGLTTPASVTVHSWDPSQQKGVKGTGAKVTGEPAHHLGSDAQLVTDQHGRAAKTWGKPLTVAGTTVHDGPAADALAGSIAGRLIGAGLTMSGLAIGSPTLRAGGTVKIEEVGAALTGSYYVTDVVHEFGEDEPFVTRFASNGHQVESTPGDASRPGDLNGWSERGLTIGVVTNINDPEKIGRVKLRFPALGDDVDSEWARVALPGGGEERGLDLRPEVDDEVIVGFEGGDPRAPIVLGGMFSARAKPFDPDVVVKGVVERRVLASRLGHSITLWDGTKPAEKSVEIELANGKTKVTIAEDGITIEAAKNTPLALKTGGASLTFTKDEKLVIKAKEVTIDSDGDLTLKAKRALSIKATNAAKIDGGLSFEAKGNFAKVESSGITTIKGGMVKIN